jgi:oxygen-independent coproporphyrinogen III oxidase
MRSQAVAFDRAHAALHRLGIPGILPTLHAAGVKVRRSVLGGSHSVAIYPPIDSLMPADPAAVVSAINCGEDSSLYVHIAFCETRCTFCHYAVQHYSGKQGPGGRDVEVIRYLEALKRELRFWGERFAASRTALSSIYIGGGTPLILGQESLGDIINTIQDCYQVVPNAEICVEGSPLTITAPDGKEKLSFLKEQGVTRLSFGVQSFDDLVLKYAARGYKRDLPIRASEIVSSIFDNWNLDLIQGLYKGSPAETWENLKVISEIRPAHLTWYHGRFADRPQGNWYKTGAKHAGFEDEAATLLGRLLIWQEMKELGYHQTDGNRFVRERHYTDPFKTIRTSAHRNLLGTGAASYSHVGAEVMKGNVHGYVFRNQSDIRSYVDCVLSGDIPIAAARVIDDEELLATSYATGLRNGRIESKELRAIRERRPALANYYVELEDRLCDVGVLAPFIGGDCQPVLQLTDLGRLFEDETLAVFFSPSVKRALEIKALR